MSLYNSLPKLKFEKPNLWDKLPMFCKIKYYSTILDENYSIYVDKIEAKKIVNEIYVKNDSTKKLISAPESKKENKMKKKYDLLVVNNAKDILILNRIIFK